MNIHANPDNETVDSDAVYAFLTDFQTSLCTQLEALDGQAKFVDDPWQREEGGGGLTRIMTNGALFEKAGVAFSKVSGLTLPRQHRLFDQSLRAENGRQWVCH